MKGLSQFGPVLACGILVNYQKFRAVPEEFSYQKWPNLSKPTIVSAADPFITTHAGDEYCGGLSNREDKIPNYLLQFLTFTDNVLDISDDVFEDIAKMQIEREWQFREEEKMEEEKLAKQHLTEIKMKTKMDKRVTSIMKTHKYFVKRSCPVKIPFKSTLTHEEHEFYMRCFIKFQISPPVNSLEEREHEQYISMQHRVFDEQSCMMNFSFKVAQLMLKEYNSVPNIVEKYIKEYVSHRCQRALSYPGSYRSEIEIPLKPQDSNLVKKNFQLRYVGHLLSLGWVPWIKLPLNHVKVTLPKDDSVWVKRRPDCDEDFDRDFSLYKCPVSEDPNAEYLAKTHGASIVMSSSAFKTIADNQEQPFDKEWNIPVKIKSCKVKDENGKEIDSRIIFIDKPLPKKGWLPSQKKFTFFKASARGTLTHQFRFPCYRMQHPVKDYGHPHPPQTQINYENEVFGDTWSDHSSNESFGTDFTNKFKRPTRSSHQRLNTKVDVEKDLFLSEDEDDPSNKRKKTRNEFPPPSSYVIKSETKDTIPKNSPSDSNTENKKRPAQLVKPVKESEPSSLAHSESEDKKDHGLLSDLLDKQSTFLKPKSKRNERNEGDSLASPFSNYDKRAKKGKQHFGKPWANTLPTDWSDYKIKECPEYGSTNVHYQLYTFENIDQTPVKSDRTSAVKVLIRHNIHGLSRFNKEPKKSRAYVVYPKLENQVYFGCEVTSVSEIVQQWANLAIRPWTTLLQIRVCIDSGEVIMTEEKTLEAVLKEGKQAHLNFNPQSVFSTLDVLFNTLSKMSSGEYLLHHSSKTEAFIKLMKAIETKEAIYYKSHFDLHQYYSDGSVIGRQFLTPPWLAIDTHVLTPFHLVHRKVPATFPMENKRKLTRNEKKQKRERANKKLSIEGYE